MWINIGRVIQKQYNVDKAYVHIQHLKIKHVKVVKRYLISLLACMFLSSAFYSSMTIMIVSICIRT